MIGLVASTVFSKIDVATDFQRTGNPGDDNETIGMGLWKRWGSHASDWWPSYIVRMTPGECRQLIAELTEAVTQTEEK